MRKGDVPHIVCKESYLDSYVWTWTWLNIYVALTLPTLRHSLTSIDSCCSAEVPSGQPPLAAAALDNATPHHFLSVPVSAKWAAGDKETSPSRWLSVGSIVQNGTKYYYGTIWWWQHIIMVAYYDDTICLCNMLMVASCGVYCSFTKIRLNPC